MNFTFGTPPTQDGRYLVYVEGFFEWLQPVIVTWQGKWKYQHSSEDYDGVVFCWMQLPVMSKEYAMREMAAPQKVYDL